MSAPTGRAWPSCADIALTKRVPAKHLPRLYGASVFDRRILPWLMSHDEHDPDLLQVCLRLVARSFGRGAPLNRRSVRRLMTTAIPGLGERRDRLTTEQLGV